MAQEAKYEVDAAENGTLEPGIPELFFYPDLRGYAWCFRKGNWINIGLGRDREQHLTQWRDRFLTRMISTGRIAHRPAFPFRGHAYRLNVMRPESVAAEGLLLIGDAAGLADSHSGESIGPAIQSALIAADTIAESQGLSTDATASLHRERLAERLPGSVAGTASSLTPAPLREWMARFLLRRRQFVRRVVLDDWFLNRTV